jgi:hypothetical protein
LSRQLRGDALERRWQGDRVSRRYQTQQFLERRVALAAESGNRREIFGIPSRETAAQREMRLMSGQRGPGRVIENVQARLSSRA